MIRDCEWTADGTRILFAAIGDGIRDQAIRGKNRL